MTELFRMFNVSKVLVRKTFIQLDALADCLTEGRLFLTLSGFVPPRLYKPLNRELTFLNNVALNVCRITQLGSIQLVLYSEGGSTDSTCASIARSTQIVYRCALFCVLN